MVSFFHLYGEFAILSYKRKPLEGGCEGFVSAWTRMGWLTRMAVIEIFGGCCHGYEGGSKEGE